MLKSFHKRPEVPSKNGHLCFQDILWPSKGLSSCQKYLSHYTLMPTQRQTQLWHNTTQSTCVWLLFIIMFCHWQILVLVNQVKIGRSLCVRVNVVVASPTQAMTSVCVLSTYPDSQGKEPMLHHTTSFNHHLDRVKNRVLVKTKYCLFAAVSYSQQEIWLVRIHLYFLFGIFVVVRNKRVIWAILECRNLGNLALWGNTKNSDERNMCTICQHKGSSLLLMIHLCETTHFVAKGRAQPRQTFVPTFQWLLRYTG